MFGTNMVWICGESVAMCLLPLAPQRGRSRLTESSCYVQKCVKWGKKLVKQRMFETFCASTGSIYYIMYNLSTSILKFANLTSQNPSKPWYWL